MFNPPDGGFETIQRGLCTAVVWEVRLWILRRNRIDQQWLVPLLVPKRQSIYRFKGSAKADCKARVTSVMPVSDPDS
jgi:hypothetical protein